MSPSQKLLGGVGLVGAIALGFFVLKGAGKSTKGGEDPDRQTESAAEAADQERPAENSAENAEAAQKAECDALKARAAQTAHDLLHKKISREEGTELLADLKRKMAACPSSRRSGK